MDATKLPPEGPTELGEIVVTASLPPRLRRGLPRFTPYVLIAGLYGSIGAYMVLEREHLQDQWRSTWQEVSGYLK